MKSREEALQLAQSLVSGAKAAGRKASALITSMDAPLGYAVGNACEVEEALEMLSPGECRVAVEKARALSVELAAEMVSLALNMPIDQAREMCREKLSQGAAKAKFVEMVAAHGGDLAAFSRLLEKPVFKYRIQAMRSGFVSAIDAERVGKVALSLGAGRGKATDRIDPLAGVRLSVAVGDKVSLGSPLATLEKSSDPDGLEKAAAELFKAFVISSDAPQEEALLLERID